MGYALFIVESLAWTLLLVAITTACAGRIRRRWLRLSLVLAVPLLLTIVHVGLSITAGLFEFAYGLGEWFYPLLFLTLFFIAGAVWLLIKGLRRDETTEATVAAAWPRGKLAIGLAAAFALYCMTYWNLDLAARQQLAVLRVEAGAVSLNVAPPRPPDRDNAAFFYERAFDAIGDRAQHGDSSPGAWIWDDTWTKTWDEIWSKREVSRKIEIDSHDRELRLFLAREASALKLLRQAAAMPSCYFEHDYGRLSISMTIPELWHFRQGARILALDAICGAGDGNYRQSVADMNAMFLMSEHIGSEPLLVSELVAIDVDEVAIESLQAIIANFPIPVGELATLRISGNVSFRVLFQRGLRGEEALRLATYDDVGSGRMQISEINGAHRPWFADPAISSAYRVFMLGSDLAAHRRFTAEMDNASRMPFWQARERLRQLGQEVRANPGGVLTAILLPAVANMMERAAAADARRDVARLGLALYAYRARNGRFPAELNELAPEFIAAVPLNPFDGKPMTLRRTNGGVTVDSSAPELPEQGKKALPLDSKNREVMFTVPDVGAAKK
jgi:hypothetical protein